MDRRRLNKLDEVQVCLRNWNWRAEMLSEEPRSVFFKMRAYIRVREENIRASIKLF